MLCCSQAELRALVRKLEEARESACKAIEHGEIIKSDCGHSGRNLQRDIGGATVAAGVESSVGGSGG